MAFLAVNVAGILTIRTCIGGAQIVFGHDIILRDYENRQLHNRHELERKTAYVYDHVPGYRELEEQIASISVSQGKKYLSGDEGAMEELKGMLSEISGKNPRTHCTIKKQIMVVGIEIFDKILAGHYSIFETG